MDCAVCHWDHGEGVRGLGGGREEEKEKEEEEEKRESNVEFGLVIIGC